jgi:hypothetical protein
MNRLVAKKDGSHLLKRSSHLVRTPIKISLSPDERAYYSVAGSYAQQGTVWWPDGGFIQQNTLNNVWTVGASCIQAYLNPSDWRQDWRGVDSSHDPETAWYQGAFAPSAPNLNATYLSCEAYIQLGAYHFSVPTGLTDLEVTSVKVKFINGGGVAAYQSAGTQSANNSQLKGKFDFGDWYLPFAVSQSLDAPSLLGAKPYDALVDILADTGTVRGARDLWGFSGTTRDGGITTLNAPVQKTYTMGAYTLSNFNANKGGWIIPYFDAAYSGARNYNPYYVNDNNGYWGCISLWGLTLEVTLG